MKKIMGIFLVIILSVGCSSNVKKEATVKQLGFSEEQETLINSITSAKVSKVRVNNLKELGAKEIEFGTAYQNTKDKKLIFEEKMGISDLNTTNPDYIELISTIKNRDGKINGSIAYNVKGDNGQIQNSAKVEDDIKTIVNGTSTYTVAEYGNKNEPIKVEKGKKYLIGGVAANENGHINGFTDDLTILNQKKLEQWDSFYGIYFILK
ncbi:MAG: hypothetical protein RR543_01250 [Erysipelotrichales bacterium]